MTEGQLLTAGIRELLEPSRALLYIVPNPGSGCDQARDSKGNTNTVLDSGCLSISSIHLFFKTEIKENKPVAFFSAETYQSPESKRVDFVASSHFFVLLKIYWIYSARLLKAVSWVELNASFIAQLLPLNTT